MRRPIPVPEVETRPELVITDLNLHVVGVTIYEDANYGGRSKLLALGQYRFFSPEDLNDVVSSIKVPPGFCAVLYEHADDGGGYGRSVDLLEDCPDLSVYDFNDKVSYINVFSTTNLNVTVRDHRGGETVTTTTNSTGYVYVRNRMLNGQFVAGHWERKRAIGGPDNSPPAVVSPPLLPHVPTAPTMLQVNGAQTVITFLGGQASWETTRWESAVADQMGVIGSDFRGPEVIGSACFQRASHHWAIPDWINFWYPQKQSRDHRPNPYFKRTLVGKVKHAKKVDIVGTYEDLDVNIIVVPNDNYMYLITDGHPREYTWIMETQYRSGNPYGKASCDAPEEVEEFTRVEAEIQPDTDPNSGTRERLVDMALARKFQDIGIYGVWIYDKGHCCHPEIHPAEQIWWRDDMSATERKYTFCLFCDASKRYWWRDQMDDGTKLKPWGAPPIRGIFAIAFEVELGKPAMTFEVADIENYNVESVPNGNQVYNLVYHNNVLVTFIPHNDAFKVSFENVGMAGPNRVRGFLVLETTVGKCIQKTTRITLQNPNPHSPALSIDIPPGADVNAIDQRFEREVFDKQEGRYMFTVKQTVPESGRGGLWTSEFLGTVVNAGTLNVTVIPTS